MMRSSCATAVAMLALGVAACSKSPPEAVDAPAAPAIAAADVTHGFGPEISAEDVAAHVKALSSDDFGGRAPGTDGEQKTADYLVAQFQRLGLQPGNGDSWFQEVPMVVTTIDTGATTLSVDVGGNRRDFAFGRRRTP